MENEIKIGKASGYGLNEECKQLIQDELDKARTNGGDVKIELDK